MRASEGDSILCVLLPPPGEIMIIYISFVCLVCYQNVSKTTVKFNGTLGHVMKKKNVGKNPGISFSFFKRMHNKEFSKSYFSMNQMCKNLVAA